MSRDDSGATDDTVVAESEPADSEADTDASATARGVAPPTTVALAGRVEMPRRRRPSGGYGRYEVGGLIGKGGMGEVMSATDTQIGREVAIKRMRSSQSSDEAQTRFLREARIQGRLDHPAIAPVHELSRDVEGRPFFAMKRLAGVTLGDVLSRLASGDDDARATFTRQKLLRTFVDVCLAVEFAHRRGVVHRDLKPPNVMLGDFGEVYVLDWGIARVVAEADDRFDDVDTVEPGQTAAGTVLGTPGYMPPEQVAGEQVDERADVYSLGCVLFEILAWKKLHPSGPAGMSSAVAGIDARPSRRNPDAEIPPELDALCVRATAAEPAARGTARQLADDVQRYLDGDRDVALRRGLARDHIERARAALAGGDDVDARAVAMREAGRALALDPTAHDAADLVGRLMLEPPREEPPEVGRELEAISSTLARNQGRLAIAAFVGYLGFLPIIAWMGIRDWTTIGLLGAMVAVNAGMAWQISRQGRLSKLQIYGALLSNAVLIGVFARVFTPFLVAPGLAAATVMVFAIHPQFGRAVLVWALMTAGVIVPWVLEVAGPLTSSIAVEHNSLILTSAVLDARTPQIEVALVAYVVVLLAMSTFIARTMGKAQRESRRALLLQAWHLRQLFGGSPAQ
jgi:serine/threonine-protein kinase